MFLLASAEIQLEHSRPSTLRQDLGGSQLLSPFSARNLVALAAYPQAEYPSETTMSMSQNRRSTSSQGRTSTDSKPRAQGSDLAGGSLSVPAIPSFGGLVPPTPTGSQRASSTRSSTRRVSLTSQINTAGTGTPPLTESALSKQAREFDDRARAQKVQQGRPEDYRTSSPPSLAVQVDFDVKQHCVQTTILGKTVYKCNLCKGGVHATEGTARRHYDSHHSWACYRCRYRPATAQKRIWRFGSRTLAEAHAKSHS